jgi:hypothetical protein
VGALSRFWQSGRMAAPSRYHPFGLQGDGERLQFLPDGKSLIYMQGCRGQLEDFWMLDLTTLKTRQLTRLNQSASMRTFDISPDGKQSCSTAFATIRYRADRPAEITGLAFALPALRSKSRLWFVHAEVVKAQVLSTSVMVTP